MPAAQRKPQLRLIVGGASHKPAPAIRLVKPRAERLVLCPVCRGDKKVKDEDGKLVRCSRCNGSGLVFEE